MEFLFRNLSPEDFEELIQDVISTQEGFQFERFKKGKDQSIDLRLLQGSSTTICQVKHMLGTYGSTHRSTFKREFTKAASVDVVKNATKYIFVASCNLSAHNKKEILGNSRGLVKSEADIYGIEDIESRLNLDDKLVRRHFKLWISSSHVLTRLLNNKILGKSDDYYVRAIHEKIKLFVKTASIDKAFEILEKHRVLVVTGEPGIGKSTLSELICMSFVERKYDFVYCDDIEEAESIFEKDKKQIFLLDDFLGSNFLDTFTRKEESRILRFIDRISASPDKRMILNSRTTIYSQASDLGIHWNNHNWSAKRFHIDIQNYSMVERAKMLYNHLCFRGIDEGYYGVVKNEKSYIPIVTHKNFNPRIIEFVTSQDRLVEIPPEKYLAYIKGMLDNPAEIWRPAYCRQISTEQRWLLQTLYMFQGEANESELKEAFDSRLDYEVQYNGYRRSEDAFQQAMRGLQDGFICRTMKHRVYGPNEILWKYLNPSIFDFINHLICDSPDMATTMAKSAKSYRQLSTMFSIEKIKSILFSNNLHVLVINNHANYTSYRHATTEFDAIDFANRLGVSLPKNQKLSLIVNGIDGMRVQNDLHTLLNEIDELHADNLLDALFAQILDHNAMMETIINSADSIEDVKAIHEKILNQLPNLDEIKEYLVDSASIHDKIATILDAEESMIIDDDDKLSQLYEADEVRQRAEQLRNSLYAEISEIDWIDSDLIAGTFKFNYAEIAEKNFERCDDSDEYSGKSNIRTSPTESIDDICRVFLD